MKHKTAKGREFNMQAFASGRGKTVAVGNSNLNAQGDLLGKNNAVIATRQEITNKVHDKKIRAPEKAAVGLNAVEKEVSRKEVIGADGISREEITFADGSVEIVDIEKTETKPKKKKDELNTGDF